jgi:5'-AMP-activated protein kinase catalytic alpha subunit
LLECVEREIRILETASHPHIVQFKEVIHAGDSIFIVMEYCSGGSLLRAITNSGGFPMPECLRLLYDILQGVNYLHDHGISHRDIKPDNILIDHTGRAKITDFGLSGYVARNDLFQTPSGSLEYCPPEVLAGDPYDGAKADIWSLGVVLYTMCGACLPWRGRSPAQIYAQAMAHDFSLPAVASRPVRDLICKMMNKNPAERPTAFELLNDPSVAGLRNCVQNRRLTQVRTRAAARSYRDIKPIIWTAIKPRPPPPLTFVSLQHSTGEQRRRWTDVP